MRMRRAVAEYSATAAQLGALLDGLARLPAGTGVESRSLSRSQNDGELLARWLMTRQISGASLRSRLL